MSTIVIKLNFTSNFPAGTYRIGYKVSTDTNYTLLIPPCTACGCKPDPCTTPCECDITVTDPGVETTYVGFIQAICNPDDWNNNGPCTGCVPWSIVYTPV